MIEREIKMKLKSPSLNDLERELQQRSIPIISTEEQEDIYFNYKYRNFKQSDEAIRLRKIGNKYELTYKGPKQGSFGKSREEITISISNTDISNIRIIMERIGLYETFIVKKIRKNFKIEKFIISLDRVEGLGEFIEIEGDNVTEGELKSFSEHFIRDFHIEGEVTNTSYLELLLMKNGKDE
ncbi:class IV adenylate cyclase [Sulfuracidifex metallicus]|uniref:class IV adenylate cyclase n=1 Tax=Sulfuracidifex metallicus TaxID=47303 RepID=UPI002273B22F|nr:class IV adenylate cyclase [Sulfuracidifex metallicus]MCY0850150.1 class IV adenylate cyclase [Sulfuracidifex metallicus]